MTTVNAKTSANSSTAAPTAPLPKVSAAPAKGAAAPAREPAEMPPALAAMMTEDEAVAAQAEAARWRYGFFVVLTGLILILIGFVFIVLTDGGGAAPFAGLVGVCGAIMGAYFGVQVGQSGKSRIEAELRRTHEMTIRLAAKVHAHDADEVIASILGGRRR
ncbi:hypothetical protein ACFOWE_33590 [Planomonospora corallina]|uniref:Holin-X, holin superfamily III n=1 Tax=Planomonospora corallina TaxID=1806052 RepID=A0ABV8II67_9ACTN